MNHDRFLDVVDFVEQHGGSLSGEARDELKVLVGSCLPDYRPNYSGYPEGRHTRLLKDCPMCKLVPDGLVGAFSRRVYDHDIARNIQESPDYVVPYTFEQLVNGTSHHA